MTRLLLLMLIISGSAAQAGVRVGYVGEESGRPVAIEIADNGDFRTELYSGAQLIVRAGEAYIVEELLTGPRAMRLDDLIPIAAEHTAHTRHAPPRTLPPMTLVQRGTLEVHGRHGRAYFRPPLSDESSERLIAVISDDPDLAFLGPVMRRFFEAEGALWELETQSISDGEVDDVPLERLLDQGAPLVFRGLRLRSVEHVPIDTATFVLPAEPETREALRSRLLSDDEEIDTASYQRRMILRATFAAGRLWLLNDNGELTSLAEGEMTRTTHSLGPVLDICSRDGVPLALTGARDRGRNWALHRWRDGRWQRMRSIQREDDYLVAMSCGTDGAMLLTIRHLIDLDSSDVLRLSGDLAPALVRTVVLVRRDAVFVGLNAGEWGGGLKRIDRRTGRIETLERNATGNPCEGPLNTHCDPVHGLASVPWRPECVAAAIGLIHFMAHGRITSICPNGIEQMFVATEPDGIDAEGSRRAEEAARGGYGSIAFFGLATTGESLIAVGHNGLYRIGRDGTAVHLRWPRFVEVDGILVSFALPDVVLVMSALNRRASVSGIAPLMAVR